MSTQYIATIVASVGMVFAPGAFDGIIGRTVNLRYEDTGVITPATISSADVTTNGLGVRLTFEIEDTEGDATLEP